MTLFSNKILEYQGLQYNWVLRKTAVAGTVMARGVGLIAGHQFAADAGAAGLKIQVQVSWNWRRYDAVDSLIYYQRNYLLSSQLALVHVRKAISQAKHLWHVFHFGRGGHNQHSEAKHVFPSHSFPQTGVSQRASAGTASLRGGCTMASSLTFGESWAAQLWWLWHGCIGVRWGAAEYS